MPRVFALRSGLTVTLNVEGTTKQFVCTNDEEAKDLFSNIYELRNAALGGDPKALENLIAMSDPGYRMRDIANLTRDNAGNFYLGNYSEPVPMGLVYKIKEYVDLGISVAPLENFWKLLMLNPDKHVRTSLFQFAERFSFPITDKGYFIAYKSVAWKGESNKDLALAVASEYIYKKAAGLDVSNIQVFTVDDEVVFVSIGEDQEYKTVEEFIDSHIEYSLEPIGAVALTQAIVNKSIPSEWEYNEDNGTYYEKVAATADVTYEGALSELYTSIVAGMDYDVPTFTDWHTRQSTIKLGEPISMPRESCDNNPDNTCSSGLHVGAPGYVSGFGGNNDSNYILACLVSPMNVVAVPHDYNFEKMRTCEYLPYAVCKLNDDGTIREVDTRYFEDDYAAIEASALDELLKEYEGLDKVKDDLTVDELQERKSLIRERLVVFS